MADQEELSLAIADLHDECDGWSSESSLNTVLDELARLRRIERAVRAVRALDFYSIEPRDHKAYRAADDELDAALDGGA